LERIFPRAAGSHASPEGYLTVIQSKSAVLKSLPPIAAVPLRTGVNSLRALVKELQIVLAHIAAKRDALASAYYLIVCGQFAREHRAVLRGKIAYLNADYAKKTSIARLRRNIHRLEKGLIMRPRRAIFAEDYIVETVRDFKHACDGIVDEAERVWARDVLRFYFTVVGSSRKIEFARQLFEAGTSKNGGGHCLPYTSAQRVQSTVSYSELLTLFQQRRSTRWFLPRSVSRHLVEKAVFAASFAPSACNRQPFHYIVIQDTARATAIGKLAGGTVGFAENIQCLIVSVGDLSSYIEERDRHLIYIDTSLANMQLMLAFETLGLSTCAINWPDIGSAEQAVSRELQLNGHERVIMLMAVGYADPDGGIPYSQKKPSEMLIHWDAEA